MGFFKSKEESPQDLVLAFESGDRALFGMVQSILEEASIPFLVKNEAIQTIIFPPGIGGVPQIWVQRKDLEDVQKMIADTFSEDSEESDSNPDEDLENQ